MEVPKEDGTIFGVMNSTATWIGEVRYDSGEQFYPKIPR